MVLPAHVSHSVFDVTHHSSAPNQCYGCMLQVLWRAVATHNLGRIIQPYSNHTFKINGVQCGGITIWRMWILIIGGQILFGLGKIEFRHNEGEFNAGHWKDMLLVNYTFTWRSNLRFDKIVQSIIQNTHQKPQLICPNDNNLFIPINNTITPLTYSLVPSCQVILLVAGVIWFCRSASIVNYYWQAEKSLRSVIINKN